MPTILPEYLQDNQRTDDWLAKRIGKFTGSGIKNLMCEGRGKENMWGETAKAYVFEKLYERVSNSHIQVPETFQMKQGKEVEEQSIETFDKRTRFYVNPAEYMDSPDVDFIGASPDGLVYDSRDKLVGVFETKCRLDQTMLKNAFVAVTEKHDAFWQLQCEMYVAGVDKAYFTHYSPERECPFDLQIQVVERDNKAIERMIERATIADKVIKDAIKSVGGVRDKRITYITLTERMIKMREYIWEHLN